METAGKIIPLKATGTDASVVTQVRPQMFSRFSEEELPKDKRTLLKIKVLKQLTSELNLKKLDTETGNDPKKMAVLREKTRQAALSIMERENITVGDKTETDLFIKEILDEALALGPLEILIADSSITEIMVNRKDQIFIEKNGKIQLAPMSFTSNAQLLGIIERIVAPLGRRIDEKTPYCDARLPDGSRVHAIIPPLALEGPVLTIRKFSKKPLIIADLIRYGSLTEDIADFLRAAIEARLNCVVSGGTGTGKTTLLNVLSSFIPERERIITVEDSAELRLTQPHVLRLEARPPNIEGTGAVTIRDLVRNTLRMRPDRIVVGECRDGAALDMLQAMNTGHDGSLTTVHANNPRDCLSRLETLVMMAGMDLPSRAIREQIASAVHLIVQQTRFSDGSRKITHITEITGMEKEVICSQDIIVFKQKGVDKDGKVIGQYEHTGHVPKFIHELEKMGLRIPKGFFIKRKTDTSPEKKD
ncbi:MAG: type II secretion system protein E [Deltaproteobacteria bacterium RIFCSPHIGHO2_02_FULL_38_15]|nr:MAG: type II secretion system protein E [Deltaproteobacteria bacterium RIFCSPHIGHO2_02_FULL_38_15]OGQ35138.1 MAG: type II secretion system protein E [Deltaproteobacteria bacterium RIFCSPLOWO2_01_FULL_38_9]